MEGETRKRKLAGEAEEEEEEEEMEMFFALIRSTRDARDRLCNKEKENDGVEEEKDLKGVWNPTFQPEDFIHDHQDLGIIRSTHVSTRPGPSNEMDLEPQQDKEPEPIAEAAPTPPPLNQDEEKAGEGDKLDLTLSL